MDDKLQPFRHPMVAATGIILGFTLRFTQVWAATAFGENRLFDFEILIGLCTCITVSTIVIYRIMSRNYPKDNEETIDRYYRTTLKLFIVAILMPFIAIFIIIAEKIILSK
jgi:hypothetical protein